MGLNSALNQSAYMLFYVLDVPETNKLGGLAPTPVPRSLPTGEAKSPSTVPAVNGTSSPQVKAQQPQSLHQLQHKTPQQGPKALPVVNGDATPQRPTTAANAGNVSTPAPNGTDHQKKVQEKDNISKNEQHGTWTVTPARKESDELIQRGWVIEATPPTKTLNGNGKRRREEDLPLQNGHKVVKMNGHHDDDDDISFTDSDAESSAVSTDEEYEEQFSEDDEEERQQATKKRKLDLGQGAPLLKWDDKSKPQPAPAPKSEAKKSIWEKTMRHEQFDKQSKIAARCSFPWRVS